MSDAWSLRKQDGTLYGPVGFDQLLEWARDGRIESEDAVQASPEAPWQPATEYPGLHMEWTVETVDGQRVGPLHIEALRVFWSANLIAPRTRVTRVRTGETADAADLLLRVMLEREERGAFAPTAERPPSPPTWSGLHQELDQVRKELAREQQRGRDAEQLAAKAHAELESRYVLLQKEYATREAELGELKIALRSSQALETTSAPESITPGRLDAAELRQMLERLSRSREAVASELETRTQELSTLRAELESMRAAASDLPAELEALRAQLNQERLAHQSLQSTHTQIQREFRELHERYLTLRHSERKPTG